MNDPVAVWHSEHLDFMRLLDLLEKQVAAFHMGDRPNYDLTRDIVYYLRHFPDRVHHPREDVAFDLLLKRHPAMQLQIDRLLQEHRVIAAAGEDVLRRLDEIAAEIFIARSTIEAAAATYLVYYRHHIATEEGKIMPLAAHLLTPKDWAAVAAAVPEAPDPLFSDHVEERYRELRRQIALEAQGS